MGRERTPRGDDPKESLQRVVRHLVHLDQTQSRELDGRGAVMHQGVYLLQAGNVAQPEALRIERRA